MDLYGFASKFLNSSINWVVLVLSEKTTVPSAVLDGVTPLLFKDTKSSSHERAKNL